MVRYGTGQIREPANIVASCLWPSVFDGMIRDRYGIAPGVTQTNKRESLEAQGPTLCFFALMT